MGRTVTVPGSGVGHEPARPGDPPADKLAWQQPPRPAGDWGQLKGSSWLGREWDASSGPSGGFWRRCSSENGNWFSRESESWSRSWSSYCNHAVLLELKSACQSESSSLQDPAPGHGPRPGHAGCFRFFSHTTEQQMQIQTPHLLFIFSVLSSRPKPAEPLS